MDDAVIDAVEALAKVRDVPMAQIALAWVLAKPGVSAPIVGASKPHHLDDAGAALGLKLEDREVAILEAAYRPHPVTGFD
jgi:aryl-alcohol dehydrogenase-like predicted oxidoreductase